MTDDHSPTEREDDLDVGSPSDVAAGMGAIVATMRDSTRKMGVFRGARTLMRLNQQNGFDCPSCAWPDPAQRSAFEFCENGAKAVADEATTKRVGPQFFARHSVAELRGWTDEDLNAAGRITHPVVLRPDATHYEEISWDDAFALLADELRDIDPNEAIFYTSGRTSNEAAFLYQLFVRAYGTNNLPDCSNMCHESSGVGLGETIGIGKGTVLLEDFDEADVIFVFGQNPGTNHPRMMSALQSAARNGCRIVSVNPLKETGLKAFIHPQEVLPVLTGRGTPLSELFVQVVPNGDVALIKGMMKAMLELHRDGEDVFDEGFIAAQTTGFDALVADLDATAWDEIEKGSGVPQPIVRQAAEIAASANRMICCWAMGLTQHHNGVANVQSVVNLLLLGGHFGRPGAGACPVRGHSNVQGDRTVGIWHAPKDSFLDALRDEFGFEPPREHGFDTVRAIEAMGKGEAKVFFAMGGNFLSASPDTDYVAGALARCKLTAHVSTKLNRSHLITGDAALILPCLGRTERDEQPGGEQFVTVENSMGIVHTSRGGLDPAGDALLSEPRLVARMAAALLGPSTPVEWEKLADDYDRIRDAIESVIPGFEDYNRRVRQANGFELPNPPRQGRFDTEDGKARFTVHDIPRHDLAADELMMMTVRSHDQFNTVVYAPHDRYRGIRDGRRVVFMNPSDIARLGFGVGENVDLVSSYSGVERMAPNFRIVSYDIPPGAVATYFPEANVLVPWDEFAGRSYTPISKSVIIRLRPAGAPRGATDGGGEDVGG